MTVAYYVGSTGTGKTTLMCSHAMQRAGERAVPAILLDSEGVVGADKWEAEEVHSREALIEKVWKEGRHVKYHPRDAEDVDALCRVIRAGGNCVLAVDEISYWARGAGLLPELARLFRVHRHSAVDLFGTSQYPADISPLIWNVKSEVYLFRNESSRAIERLTEECSLSDEDAEEIANLENMRYVKWTGGPKSITQTAGTQEGTAAESPSLSTDAEVQPDRPPSPPESP
jgi:hypothetical protein